MGLASEKTRHFLKANFLGWVGLLVSVTLVLAISWMIGRIDLNRMAVLLLVLGTVWNFCVAIFFPGAEILAWLGIYKKDANNLKGQTGVKADEKSSFLALAAVFSLLAFIPSMVLHGPALFLIRATSLHSDAIISFVLIFALTMAILMGVLSAYIARLRAIASAQ